MPKNWPLQAQVSHTSFYSVIIYEVLWLHTVLHNEKNVPRRKRERVKGVPQRSLLFSRLDGCHYLNMKLMNQFLADHPNHTPHPPLHDIK